MKFGKVENAEIIDFSLPLDHEGTKQVLPGKKDNNLEVSVGCAKWNKNELKGFYPRGTKDELTYYSTQFNAIELNATFYNDFGFDQMAKWRDKTPDRFCYPVPQRYTSRSGTA